MLQNAINIINRINTINNRALTNRFLDLKGVNKLDEARGETQKAIESLRKHFEKHHLIAELTQLIRVFDQGLAEHMDFSDLVKEVVKDHKLDSTWLVTGGILNLFTGRV